MPFSSSAVTFSLAQSPKRIFFASSGGLRAFTASNTGRRTDGLFRICTSVAIESLLRQENLAESKGGALVYSPLCRFVTEPFVFNIHEGASAYLSNALSYILRSERVSNVIKILDDENYEIKIQEDAGKYPIMKIVIIGKAKLERVEFFGEETFSCIDLAGKKIIISNAHSPICFDALNKTGQMDLKNIRLEKSQERVEISYVG